MYTFVYLFVVYFSFAPVISASIHRYVTYFDIQVLMMGTETETLTSTLHHNKFTYLDYVFLLSSYIYIYIYIYTNLQSSSIHCYQEKRKKKTPVSRDNNILNYRPGKKEKNIIGQKKKKANFVKPVEKNGEICNQLVKRKRKTHRKMLQCYNYRECSIQS